MIDFRKNELIAEESDKLEYTPDITCVKTYIVKDNKIEPAMVAHKGMDFFIAYRENDRYVFDYLYNHINKFVPKKLEELDIEETLKKKILTNWNEIKKETGAISPPIFSLEKEDAATLYREIKANGTDLIGYLDNSLNIVKKKGTPKAKKEERKIEKPKKKGVSRTEKKKEATSQKNGLFVYNKEEYQQFLAQRVAEANKEARRFFNNIQYNKENKAEKEIAKSIKAGKYPLLIGQSGISKTYATEKIARENNIPLVVLRGTRDTEASHIVGMPIISKISPFDPSQTVKYKDGYLTKAVKMAQKGQVMFLIDEIGKINDTTALISGISKNSLGEIGITVNENRDFILAKASIKFGKESTEGYFWMEVADNKEMEYEIDFENGAVLFEIENPQDAYKLVPDTGGTELTDVEERAARGDILKVYQGDVTKHKEFFESITKKIHSADKEFYAPYRNLIFVGTGNNHEDSDSFDMALLSRFDPKYIERPPLSLMTKLVIEKRIENGEIFWEDSQKEKVISIIEEFISNVEDRFVDNNDEFINRRADFRTIEAIVDSIDIENPFDKESDGYILDALQDNIGKFIDAESVMAIKIEDIKRSSQIQMVKDLARTIVEKYTDTLSEILDESDFNIDEQQSTRMKL